MHLLTQLTNKEQLEKKKAQGQWEREEEGGDEEEEGNNSSCSFRVVKKKKKKTKKPRVLSAVLFQSFAALPGCACGQQF